MLESLRPPDYMLFREAATSIFLQHNGDSAITTFGLDEVFAADSGGDLSAAYAFLEAQGYRGATTPALGRLGATGLVDMLGNGPGEARLLLASQVGSGPLVAVPGIGSGESVCAVLAGVGLVLLDPDSIHGRPADETDKYLTVIDTADVSWSVMVPDHAMNGLNERLLARTQLAVAAELLGLCCRILDDALTYAKTRHQFGRAVTDFQALQHLLAWAATERHQLVCLFDLAVAEAATGTIEPQLSQAVKAMAGSVMHNVVQTAMQATGAISFTWEYEFNRLHRRALCLDQLAGSSADLVVAMGRQLRTEGQLPELLGLESIVG